MQILTISLISHHFSPFPLCLQTFSYKNWSVGLAAFHGFAWILLTEKCTLCFGLAECQSSSDFQCQAEAQTCFEWQTKVCVGMWKQVVWDVWYQQSIWSLECDCTVLCTPNLGWYQQWRNFWHLFQTYYFVTCPENPSIYRCLFHG